jgi:hypothetical protein
VFRQALARLHLLLRESPFANTAIGGSGGAIIDLIQPICREAYRYCFGFLSLRK